MNQCRVLQRTLFFCRLVQNWVEAYNDGELPDRLLWIGGHDEWSKGINMDIKKSGIYFSRLLRLGDDHFYYLHLSMHPPERDDKEGEEDEETPLRRIHCKVFRFPRQDTDWVLQKIISTPEKNLGVHGRLRRLHTKIRGQYSKNIKGATFIEYKYEPSGARLALIPLYEAEDDPLVQTQLIEQINEAVNLLPHERDEDSENNNKLLFEAGEWSFANMHSLGKYQEKNERTPKNIAFNKYKKPL